MMAAVVEAGDVLVELVREVQAAGNEELTKSVKKQAAHVMGNYLVFVMNPIGTLHPDLYPVALRPAPTDISLFSND